MQKLFCFIVLGSLSSFILSSCGTVLSVFGNKSEVSLLQAPNDLKTKIDGKDVEMESIYVAGRGIGSVTTSYYSSGVKFDNKKIDHTLELYSNSSDKRVTLEMKAKRNPNVFWINLIFAPIVGHIIDGVTKNNRWTAPRYVDVEYALAGKEQKDWRSKSKLKRLAVRKIKGK